MTCVPPGGHSAAGEQTAPEVLAGAWRHVRWEYHRAEKEPQRAQGVWEAQGRAAGELGQ